MLTLSGSTPKVPGKIQDLALFLGPDFSTDVLMVETKDHARLNLQLSYNWHFDRDPTKFKGFAVKDFVGSFCKQIASKIRGAVAGHVFEFFHKNSAVLIRGSRPLRSAKCNTSVPRPVSFEDARSTIGNRAFCL